MSLEFPPQSSSSQDNDPDSLVMLIGTPQQFERLGIELGAAWRRDDAAVRADGVRAVYVYSGEPDLPVLHDDHGLLSTKELAERMHVTVQAIYSREQANDFFSVVPPARKRGRKYPAFLLDPRLDAKRLKELIELFRQHDRLGITTNDLLNFLQSVRDELGDMTPLDSLLGRTAGGPGERQRILDMAKEEIANVSS